jgi:hypothetical protein
MTARDRRRNLRLLAAMLVAAADAIHLYLWFDFFHRVHVVGALFLANAAAGVLIALWLLASRGVPALLGELGRRLARDGFGRVVLRCIADATSHPGVVDDRVARDRDSQ